mmetsp:Transcript_13869/g.20988  ORF Transcript_13869/g.20988 Transcript_13869/m.20988 type:complete len:485 (-) Transcript_13869:2673-4127(-)
MLKFILKRPLQKAIDNINVERAYTLVKRGAPINAEGENGRTTLQLIMDYAGNEKEEKMKNLIKWGATLKKNNSGLTPLFYATKENFDNIVSMLIEKKEDVNVTNRYQQTPLLIAYKNKNEQLVHIFLKAKANLEIKDHLDKTLLLHAVEEGDKQTTELFIKHHANVNVMSKYEGNALHIASKKGHLHLIDILLKEGVQMNTLNDYGQHPLHIAKDGLIIDALLKHEPEAIEVKSKSQDTPLIAAARSGNESVVRALLKHKANVNAKAMFDQTALYAACSMGKENIIDLLLNHKADIEISANFGETPLHIAARYGHAKICERLLRWKPTSVHLTNSSKKTALHEAAEHLQVDAINTLIAAAADVNATTDYSKNTPLHLLASNFASTKIKEALISAARCFIKNKSVVIDQLNSDGLSPIHLAIQREHAGLVDLLMDRMQEKGLLKVWVIRSYATFARDKDTSMTILQSLKSRYASLFPEDYKRYFL